VPKVVSARRPQSKPKLGQHFLASEGDAIRIVEALGDVSQSTVLEIGPGRGILTSLLVRRARRVIAVELDRVLAAQLRLKFGMARNIEIIEGDILAVVNVQRGEVYRIISARKATREETDAYFENARRA